MNEEVGIMKRYTLKCIKCGKRIAVTGDDLDIIYKKVVAAGWGGCDDICTDCLKIIDDPSCDPN
jgi:hypothetical protein